MPSEEVTKLTCPICREKMDGFEPMLNHLVTEHEISKRKATFLAKKMVEWKQGELDPTLFPPVDYRGIF
ncbi:MAG: hypothetical protein MUP21_08800 [Dehalococcoidia bacterium]|nr:hypothetical protein [Dehalococcoidia bacterium]